MKKCITALVFLGTAFCSWANHITGGEMFYTYVGLVNGMHQYNVTLKFYQRCGSGRLFADPNIISVFDKATNARLMDISAELDHEETISLPPDPCITNPPLVCYNVGYYYFTVNLAPSSTGYILASEVNFRINGITNLASYSQLGATYTCEVPGNGLVSSAPANNSAKFIGSDLVIVCANNNMSYSFAASDADGDQLRYSFCTAYNSTTGGTSNGSPAGPPPYPAITYNGPDFTVSDPLGDLVQLNSTTGLITGVAPQPGIYVVTVCVEEIRNGVVIAAQRKDLQINVADCSIASAQLRPEYSFCRSSPTISIVNQSNSPLINTWRWTIYDPSGAFIYTTDTPDLNYTFSSPGTYTVKLVVNSGQPCSSESTTLVHVYPGLVVDFDINGICLGRPTSFTDQSTTVFGTINSWKWDFGETSATNDVSTQQNNVYAYPTQGTKDARLVVTTTLGCRDTVVKQVVIYDKPPIGLAFKDTLTCINDPVQLQASGLGIFTWSPAVNIINPNTATPTVSPASTTTYYVDMDYLGCLNRDSVRVRVVDHVTLQPMNDTTICANDPIQLRVVSDALRYTWTPSMQLNNSTIQNPLAVTPVTTNYQVIARIGSCSASSSIIVSAVPYPRADAGPDTSICFNTTAQLHSFTDGSSWTWSPPATLSNSASLNPVAHPSATSSYIFTAFDTIGCPKPGRDTVKITVLPPMNVSAGKDTAVVIGESLQLSASGADTYLWSPAIYLSNPAIANPIGIFNEISNGLLYKVVGYNAVGCTDSALIIIRVFANGPAVFVPSAFTPNNDGRNDILRPIAVGIKQIEYFRVYNRWGQLVFATTVNGQGWDGRVGGEIQTTNSFVWQVKAVDFRGVPYFRKGVVTLIR